MKRKRKGNDEGKILEKEKGKGLKKRDMQHRFSRQCLDAKGEFHANVDLTGHLDHLRELNRFFSGVLQVLNREDLESRVVDL